VSRAAVVIAVKKAGTLPELKAAIDGATRFAAWARQANLDPVVSITDEEKPVTAKAIKDAIKDLVNSDSVQQLFIYFAGHGVNLHYGEYWLLSDAPEDTQEAINVAGSVQLAKRSGIPHVIFISDACRTAPEGIQAQAIRGSEIFPNQARGGPQRAVDVFYASLLGEPALEIQDKEASALRYDSLFTAELMAALQGERFTILSPSDKDDRFFLRPQPLKRHLMSEVPKLVAAKVGATSEHSQTPDAEILSNEFAFLQVFDGSDPNLKRPPEVAATPTRTVRGRRNRNRHVTTEDEPTLVQAVLKASTADGRSVVKALRQSGSKAEVSVLGGDGTPFESTVAEMPCGFKLQGAALAATRASGNATAHVVSPERVLVQLQPSTNNVRASSTVLLELSDGRSVVLPALNRFVATLTFEDADLVNVSYEPSDDEGRQSFMHQRDEIATLRGLVASSVHRGVFRLERSDAPRLTQRIRNLKGLDPTLAIYAAYAYHRLGQADLIQEMETVLVEDVGVTFFDVAMLADRDAASGWPVLPFVPLLGQGWSLLGAFGQDTPLLSELRTHVSSRSLWTIFDPGIVETLRTELKGLP
jgi:hypothetical protein